MAVNPQTRTILDARAGLPPLHTLTVAEAGARFKASGPPGLRIAEVASALARHPRRLSAWWGRTERHPSVARTRPSLG